MIAKGTTHDNGGRLATYMVNGKLGERAELWQLRGFAADQIKDAFRSVHVMADATRCEQPLFHVQVRNPAGEHLDRQQWERVADRIESKLGLTDQPRAIAFHQDGKSGDEHMHVGWSRIDEMTLTAKALPFFKLRLKEVSRELETELGLTPVRNEREGAVMAPKRDEDEQARRLGVDIRDVRSRIRECWERSDNGHSFATALASENLILAKGDKRDFMAVDHEGGMHGLGKRILGNTAGEVRARMADLDRDGLPTIEQARAQVVERRQPVAENTVTHANELAWKDAVREAAEEKLARRLSAPESAGSIERTPEPDQSTVEIRDAYRASGYASQFSAALARNGIHLAVVTLAEAKHETRYRAGEIVAVDQSGQVYQLDERMTGVKSAETRKFLASLDHCELRGIEATQEQIYFEARLHVALSQVGALPVCEPETGRPASAPPPAKSPEDERPDADRMLIDIEYRRRVERQIRDRREIDRTSHTSNRRERDRDRL